MRFEYLSQVQDTSGSIERVGRRCKEAVENYSKQDPNYNECVSKCFQGLMTMIRFVYDRQSFDSPMIHNPKPQAPGKPDDADYMHHDSPFASWLNNQVILNKCHSIRTKKNNIVSHPGDSTWYATAEDAGKCIKDLDDILQTICNKLSSIVIRDPGDHHQPCVLLLDISGSMNGADGTAIGRRPIDKLNEAIKVLKEDITNDEIANDRVEVCVITFNDEVELVQSFKNADQLNLPKLVASGTTAMNGAIELAIDVIERQRAFYKSNGVFFYRPWLFLFSDGMPTDEEKSTAAHRKLQNAIRNKHVIYFPTSIDGWANNSNLVSYYPDTTPNGERIIIRTEKDSFKNFFVWLSDSLKDSVNNGTQKDFRLPQPEGFVIERC